MRGYGFIAADDGGEDVFVHANTLGDDRFVLAPGVPVEFEASESDRGLKAVSVRVLGKAPDPVAGGVVAQGAALPAPESVTARDDDVCDVLPVDALTRELTEVLLESVPELTGAQIVRVRRRVVDIARKYGWVED